MRHYEPVLYNTRVNEKYILWTRQIKALIKHRHFNAERFRVEHQTSSGKRLQTGFSHKLLWLVGDCFQLSTKCEISHPHTVRFMQVESKANTMTFLVAQYEAQIIDSFELELHSPYLYSNLRSLASTLFWDNLTLYSLLFTFNPYPNSKTTAINMELKFTSRAQSWITHKRNMSNHDW